MATYQFVIELIPEVWVENNKNKVESLYDDDLYDLSIVWKAYRLSANLDFLLSQILPKGKSWDKDLLVWGYEKQSDIQVWHENNHISSIKFRLDLRENIEVLIKKIVNLAIRMNCKLFLPCSKEIIDPKIDILNRRIMRSNAVKYVNDPYSYLDEKRK